MPESTWTAIILTGGASTRLGVDKSTVTIAGKTTLEQLVRSFDVPIVVVGPDDQGLSVIRVQESPAGSGPVAGIAAALPHIHTDIVGVIATDMPFAAPVLTALVHELSTDADAVLAIDGQGREQYLCAAYRTAALRAVVHGDVQGRSMRSVVQDLHVAHLPIADHGRLLDIDTPEDLINARAWEANHADMD
jgi:molybdopterin-guanine dinucleotide biosynthesis protein A